MPLKIVKNVHLMFSWFIKKTSLSHFFIKRFSRKNLLMTHEIKVNIILFQKKYK